MRRRNFFCDKPWENILVEVNGDCYFCCHIHRPSGRIGNLKKDTLEQAWTSRKANKTRRLIAQGKIPYFCQVCPFFGEYKHEKLSLYKIYFKVIRAKDILEEIRQSGLKSYISNRKMRKISQISRNT